MAVYDYATTFTQLLQQKYAKELCSDALTQSNQSVKFINAQTIKLPRMTVSGYKDHTRTPGFNSGTLSNDWEAKKLEHDRDVEFWIDPMDIDETNQVASIQNITKVFNEEKKFPEMDAYLISKIYADWTAASGAGDTTAVTVDNILTLFDGYMTAMDEANVPAAGRILYVTPPINAMLKEAKQIARTIQNGDTAVNRAVESLDEVKI